MKKHVLKMYFILLLLGSSVGFVKAQGGTIGAYCLPPFAPGHCNFPDHCYIIDEIKNFTYCDIDILALYNNCLQYVDIGTSLAIDLYHVPPLTGPIYDSITGVYLYDMLCNNITTTTMTPWQMPCLGGFGDDCDCQCPIGIGIWNQNHTALVNLFDYNNIPLYNWGVNGNPNTYRLQLADNCSCPGGYMYVDITRTAGTPDRYKLEFHCHL